MPRRQKRSNRSTRQDDGKKIWQSNGVQDGAQYSSIIPIEHDGKRQYVQLFQKTLAGVSAKNGDLVWRSEWTGRTAVIPTPIYKTIIISPLDTVLAVRP